MAEHVRFTVDTGVRSTSAIPTAPGSAAATRTPTACSASTFPKGTDLSVHSQAELDAVAVELNGRPRQTLGWMKPSEALAKLLR